MSKQTLETQINTKNETYYQNLTIKTYLKTDIYSIISGYSAVSIFYHPTLWRIKVVAI